MAPSVEATVLARLALPVAAIQEAGSAPTLAVVKVLLAVNLAEHWLFR